MKQDYNRGQILLIVILTMAVALTVGLSLASRTLTNLKISKNNEESQRAFQAAESGIEAAIKGTANPSGDLGNNAAFKTLTKATGGESAVILNNNDMVGQDIGLDVWLSKNTDYSNQMPAAEYTIYWGSTTQTTCTKGVTQKPAIEVIALYGSKSNPQLKKAVFDPCTGSQKRIDGALDTTNSVDTSIAANGTSNIYKYNGKITLPGNGLVMKIIPLYTSSPVSVKSSGAVFPSQGSVIESTGTSGDTVRKVTYYSAFPQMPLEYFSYAIISQ